MSSPATSEARTVVITGGNSGLGYAAAAAVLSSPNGPPWHVVLAARDAGRAAAAVGELAKVARTGSKVEAMALDLASLASVRSFAADLAGRLRSRQLPPLHALVCNAGVRDASAPIRFAARYVLPHARPVLRRFVSSNVRTPEEAGGALAWLATDPGLAATTGKYFDGRRIIRSSEESYDQARADELWEASLALTHQPSSAATR